MASPFLTTSQSPYVIAHRCGGADGPENTIYAAELALKNGAHVLQVDCTFTLDKQIVVLHDEPKENNLAKLCGDDFKGVFAQDLKWSEFPTLLQSVPANALCAPATIPTDQSPPKSNTFALLKDFLLALPHGTLVLLELWSENLDLVSSVVSVLDDLSLTSTTAIGHPFNTAISDAIDKLNDTRVTSRLTQVTRIMNAKEIIKANFTPSFMLRKPSRSVVYSVPIVTKRWGELFALVLKKSSAPFWLRGVLSIIGWMFWSPSTVAKMRAYGVPSFAWILNDKEEMDVGRRLAVDGLMTDYVVASAAKKND